MKHYRCHCGDQAVYAHSCGVREDGHFRFKYFCEFHGAEIRRYYRDWKKLYTKNHGYYFTERENAPDFWDYVDELELEQESLF